MFGNKLRALATVLALGSASIAVVGLATVTPAEAAVRAAVGRPLQEARSLAANGNYSAAMAKVREAEGVGGLSGEERSIISQMRQYISVKSGSGGLGAKAKFANDYRAGRYGAVIADADELRRNGALDAQSMRVVAQSYYMLHNYAACLRYIKSNLGYGGASSLAMACAAGAGDQEAMRDLMRDVVMGAPTPDNWKRLIQSAEGTKGMGDHETLDLYRIKKMTGALNTTKPDDYALLAQLALQFGSSAEAYSVTKTAFDAKIMQGDRWLRLLNLAKQQMDNTNANFAKNLASARAEKRGENLIKLGEYQVGAGRAQDGITNIQLAMKKQIFDQGGAKLRLGYALLMAGQKDAAIRTFNSVKESPPQQAVAGIWVIYAKTSK